MTKEVIMRKFYMLAVMTIGVLAALFFMAAPAGAETATEVVPTTVTLEPWVVAILAGTVTPILTGLVTKLGASSALKAITGFVIVAVATVINIIVTSSGTFVVRDTVIIGATTFVVHVATYYGLWKPVGANNLLPNQGLGSPPG